MHLHWSFPRKTEGRARDWRTFLHGKGMQKSIDRHGMRNQARNTVHFPEPLSQRRQKCKPLKERHEIFLSRAQVKSTACWGLWAGKSSGKISFPRGKAGNIFSPRILQGYKAEVCYHWRRGLKRSLLQEPPQTQRRVWLLWLRRTAAQKTFHT